MYVCSARVLAGMAAFVLLSLYGPSPLSAAQLPLKVLYAFTGGSDGGFPKAGVIADSAGNLYGTASSGGTGPCKGFFAGCGVVYEVTASGQETVLHDFEDGSDGSIPLGGLYAAHSGLFGVTTEGGLYANCPSIGCGVVYRVAAGGQESVLYAFAGGLDGADPYAETLLADASGTLYGTTDAGGSSGGIGNGTVFALDANGETVLHRFGGPPDGALPFYGLVFGPHGVLFGTTYAGGNGSCGYDGQGCGTVFAITRGGNEKVVHVFSGADGKYPQSGLVSDGAGDLYGTTNMGGSGGFGTVYEIDRTGKETVLHSFAGGTADGRDPYGNLTIDEARGRLYGTTQYGGSGNCDIGCGTVYELTRGGRFRLLHSFQYSSEGGYPTAGVYLGADENLYGTTYQGGAYNFGTVYELQP